MKFKWLYLISAMILLIGCKTEVVQSQGEEQKQVAIEQKSEGGAELVITDNAIGPFHRGALIDMDVLTDEEQLVEKFDKVAEEKYYSYLKSNKEGLRIYPAVDPRTKTYSNLIGHIVIVDDGYMDKEGISVGSTIKEFLAQYPSSYLYYDKANDQIIMSDQGHGPQYIVSSKALKTPENINIGRINVDDVNQNIPIQEIRIVRSNHENQDAMTNKGAEENEIIEDYLETLVGKYFRKEYTENYYKIHFLQGDYLVSECFEGECTERGKIVSTRITNRYIPLSLKGISGEMVPTWTLENKANGELALHVHDYDAANDSWHDKIYYKSEEE